jgi:hypothetical protein
MEGYYQWTDISFKEACAAQNAMGPSHEYRWAKDLLSGIYVDANLPIKWDCLNPSPLHELLRHSDCEGVIAAGICDAIADALDVLLPLLPEGGSGDYIPSWRRITERFIAGLRLASANGEDVVFH